MKINVIDIETFGVDYISAYCCGAVYKNKTVMFFGLNCVNKMLIYLFNLCENNTLFFAHNLTFDGCVILSELSNKFKINNRITNIRKGEVFCLALDDGVKTLIFKCSYRILPLKLEELALKLQLPNKLPFEHGSVTYENFESRKYEIIEYCKRDLKITQTFLTMIMFSLNKIYPEWCYKNQSISGVAFGIFSKKFNNHSIDLNLTPHWDDILRPAYYGGRCEVFGNAIEGETVFHFDFTGMYTRMMREKFPIGTPVMNNNAVTINKPGFYFIDVYSDLSLPVLPLKKDGKLFFPNGYFSGLYWYEEVFLFLREGGKVLKVHWSVEYEKEAPVFADFAEICSTLRKQTLIDQILWKSIPNSFIGRLGLRFEQEKTLLLDDAEYDPLRYDQKIDKKINNLWIVRVNTDVKETKWSGNVTYAAITTAKARIVWWESAKAVAREGGRLLYCDTDSLFVAYRRDVTGETHGEVYWDPSKKDLIINKSCFATCKVYAIESNSIQKTHIKGVPLNSTTYEDFCSAFYNNRAEEVKCNFFEKKNLEITVKTFKKIIKMGGYDKRIFNKEKTTTTSLFLTTRSDFYPK